MIKIFTSLLLLTEIKETKLNEESITHSFELSFLNESYFILFKNTLQIIQHFLEVSLIHQKKNLDSELVESYLVLIYYIVMVVPMSLLIKCGFFDLAISFTLDFSIMCPIISFKASITSFFN